MTTSAQLIAWLKSNTARRCVLMEAGVQIGGVESVRYLSNKGYLTGPTETPANTRYQPLIAGGVSFTESLSLTGETQLSSGQIDLTNENGAIDSWQNDVWQNRSVKIYIGDITWTRDQFYLIFDGIIEQSDCNARDTFSLMLGDKLARLNTVVTEVKLGGTSANKDKLIPLLFGDADNISPLLVDLANLEYQIHNGPVEDIIEVRDNGIPVGFTKYLSTGKFRLTQQPVGTITCTAQGDKPSAYTNDPVGLIKRLVKDFGQVAQRFVDADLDLTSLSAFSALNQQPLGIYLTDKANVLDVCNQFVSSIGARVAMTTTGLLYIVKLDLPQASAGTTITSSDITEHSLYVSQMVPIVAAIKLGYCKNWTPQTALQTGIPASSIDLFEQAWLSSTSANSTVAATYKLFTDTTMTETLLVSTADADAEALRRKNLWSVQRRVIHYDGLSHLMLEQLGNPQTVKHSRFGLSAGVRGQIINKVTDWLNAKIVMEILL